MKHEMEHEKDEMEHEMDEMGTRKIERMKFCVGQRAWMDGRDPEATPPLTVRRINLWDGVPRRKVVRSLRHGMAVKVIDTEYFKEEGRWYYRVRRIHSHVRYWRKAGWVPGRFLCGEKPEVLGDLI
jgi:hypothetical protein